MFTGLVQKKGKFAGLNHVSGGTSIQILCSAWENEPLVFGESVAVQGACLTVTEVNSDGFFADVLEETLNCTNLGTLKYGDYVNLERALRISDRLGGHIVGGHIDGVGRIIAKEPAGRDFVFRISCDEKEARYIVRKGSVAIDGISLTISAVPAPDVFEVAVIPTTLHETSLGTRAVGDTVNIETDIMARYIEKFMSGENYDKNITFEQLAEAGFSY